MELPEGASVTEVEMRASESMRDKVLVELASQLGASSIHDVQRLIEARLRDAEAGRLTETQLHDLDYVSDQLQRLEALEHLWTFGLRYLSHYFVSQAPVCVACKSIVPHRTLLFCPTCQRPGPWLITEQYTPSSYVHYFLADQIVRLFDGRLSTSDGRHQADGMVTALPRGGAKSTWLCVGATLWSVLTGRLRCPLVLSNTSGQVTQRTLEIRNELENNEILLRDFGPQMAGRQEGRLWTQDEFVLPNGGRVVGRSAGQSMRGVRNNQYRPDGLVVDDVDDEKFMTSPERAAELHTWWASEVIPACDPQTVVMFHGTVLGDIALLWQVMNGPQGSTYMGRTFKALRDTPGCQGCGLPTHQEGPHACPICRRTEQAVAPSSFWPKRFTPEALRAIRDRIGHWAFQTEFQQEPNSDTTSWFKKEWLTNTKRDDLGPLVSASRRVIPWPLIACSLTGEELLRVAQAYDAKLAPVPGDLGPYQVIVQCWDPAWARKKQGKDQLTAWMAGVGIGLTWDDKFDIFWLDRKRGQDPKDYRTWMYETWTQDILPIGPVHGHHQLAMIIEENGAGVLYQGQVEEHWASIPVVSHKTGVDKFDLHEGLPGMASAVKAGRFIIRAGGSDRQRDNAAELIYEMSMSGGSQFTDLLMATWFGWSWLTKWLIQRDNVRYSELMRRNGARKAS